MFTALPVFRSRLRMNRALQAGVLFILLVRGLLSGAVMFDVHVPSGGFGLVLCSGSGAMFASDANADAEAHASLAGMSMPMSASWLASHEATPRQSNVDAIAHTAGMPSTHSHRAATAGMDSGICAFSAALCAAIVTLAGFGLRLPARVRRTIRAPRALRSITRRTAYRFALSRAPPSRSISR